MLPPEGIDIMRMQPRLLLLSVFAPPSLLVGGVRDITDDEIARIKAGEQVEPTPKVCHSFVRDGRIEFLSDCTHELAGQTVELEEW